MQSPTTPRSYLALLELQSPAQKQTPTRKPAAHTSTSTSGGGGSSSSTKTKWQILFRSDEASRRFTLSLTRLVCAARKSHTLALSKSLSVWKLHVLSASIKRISNSYAVSLRQTFLRALHFGRGAELILRSCRNGVLRRSWASWLLYCSSGVHLSHGLVTTKERHERRRASDAATALAHSRRAEGAAKLARTLLHASRVRLERRAAAAFVRWHGLLVAGGRAEREQQALRGQLLEYEALMTSLSLDLQERWGNQGAGLFSLANFASKRVGGAGIGGRDKARGEKSGEDKEIPRHHHHHHHRSSSSSSSSHQQHQHQHQHHRSNHHSMPGPGVHVFRAKTAPLGEQKRPDPPLDEWSLWT